MTTTPRSRMSALPPGLARRSDEHVVAGVCAGVARWLGVDPIVVRLAAVVLALANGVGIVAYVAAWIVLPEAAGAADGTGASGATGAAGTAGAPRGPGVAGSGAATTGDRSVDGYDGSAGGPAQTGRRNAELALAVGCITVGVLVLVRWTVPVFPDRLVWPAVIAAVGIGMVLIRSGEGDRARWREAATRLPGNPAEVLRGGWGIWVRVVVGAVLLVVGIATFIAANEAFSAVGQVGIAVLATALGVAVVFGPWILRLAVQLRDERRERIRSEERADMAAHLHDSVLQTLALIQRHAEEPQQSRSLARRQERELRAWLYDDRRRAEAEGAAPTLALALDRMADEVEADHGGVEVDVVLVGDCALDPGVDALVKAVREAVVNAARHSGVADVSVYAEVADGRVEAFVRDRGRGFDPRTVDGDRQGVARSIIGRMARHGGRAQVHSAPGEGTEVIVEVACQSATAGRTPQEGTTR
jgi:signal transduction histidine kinase/phage shock protein PspC (stress-responsive transcriptional regulator)